MKCRAQVVEFDGVQACRRGLIIRTFVSTGFGVQQVVLSSPSRG